MLEKKKAYPSCLANPFARPVETAIPILRPPPPA